VSTDRQYRRQVWLNALFGSECRIEPLAGDASFRCYFRVYIGDGSRVLMDAPPKHEDVETFLKVRAWMEDAGLRVPVLEAMDIGQGFLLLEDFGDTTWATYLSAGNRPDALLEDGLRQLQLLQSAPAAGLHLPLFDESRMCQECDLYLDWYLPRVAGHQPSDGERNQFYETIRPLLREIAGLPQVPVHLDYHSRNLMLPAGGLPLGVIDFQDAVLGPVTYDLASLLYDCYQDYSESNRRHWSRLFFNRLSTEAKAFFGNFEEWHRGLRLTAMQRHIKAIGIFARLAYRDDKRQFLEEIPLTRKHLLDELSLFTIDRERVPLLFMA